MAENKKYYLGKGKVRLFNKDATTGLPTTQFFWANAPELKLSVTVEKKEHTESYSGVNAVDNSVIIKSAGEISLSVDELTKETYELITRGTSSTVASGSFSAFTLASPAIGKVYKLPGTGLTSVTVVDSTPVTPATVSSAKYSIDLVYGTIEVLAISGTTGNWKVGATYEAVDIVQMLQASASDYFVHFEGINLADNSKVLLEIPTARFEPSSETDFIGDDYAKYPLKAQLIPAEDVISDANFENLGPFGRLVLLG